jgi:hypothetical protein
MKVVAFLQNMWFKDPERMKAQLAGTFKGDRAEFIRTWLFWSCLTGKRLRNAFGEELCDAITWEEASAEIGGRSSSAFPADPAHMRDVIERHRPNVVMAFGKIAQEGFFAVMSNAPLLGPRYPIHLIVAPHPAARHGSVVRELASAAAELGTILAGEASGRSS